MSAPVVETAEPASPSLEDKVQDLEARLLYLWDAVQAQGRTLQEQRGQSAELERKLSELNNRASTVATRFQKPLAKRPAPPAPAPAPALAAPPRRRPWGAYALLAGAAILFSWNTRTPEETKAAPVSAAAANPMTPKLAAPADESDAALNLVYALKVPGRPETVLDLIGTHAEDLLNPNPWQVERLDRDTYLVTYKASSDDPGYRFEVDVAEQSVYIQPETEKALLAADRG